MPLHSFKFSLNKCRSEKVIARNHPVQNYKISFGVECANIALNKFIKIIKNISGYLNPF